MRILVALRRLRESAWGLAGLGVTIFVVGLLIGYQGAFLLRPQRGVLPLQPSPFETGELLVKFRPGTPGAQIAALHGQNNVTHLDEIGEIGLSRLRVPAGSSVGQVVQAYQRNPNVQYAEPNYRRGVEEVPNDPLFGPRQWNLQKIGGPDAWNVSTGSPSVIVGVVDTGLFTGHEDLAGQFVAGASFVDYTTTTDDDHGHGTTVSGIIVSRTNNATGVAGIARGSKVMPLKACDSTGSCLDFAVARAIIYAADNQVPIVNLSVGGGSSSNVLTDAVNYAWGKGVFMAAAAGNNGTEGIMYPAALPHVVAVGATDGNDVKANFSNTGPQLAVVAPGLGIYSTERSGTYASHAGTSYSTPHVAGLAALIKSAAPALSGDQIANVLTSTAVDLGAGGVDPSYGYGRINAAAALRQVTGQVTGGGAIPTATSAPAAPTATAGSAPAPTATSAVSAPTHTATSAPAAPTATTVPATAVPATATSVPPTATTVPAANQPVAAPTETRRPRGNSGR
jgi:thermitase